MDRIKNIKFTRKFVIKLILLSPLIALMVYGLLIRPVQVRLEQRDFQAAEAYLEQKKNEIEKLAGPADRIEKENSCGYSSAKFSKGTLYCATHQTLLYRADNLEEANKKLKSIAPLNNGPIYGAKGLPTTVFGEESNEKELGEDLADNNDMSCRAYYTYGEQLEVGLVCSNEAMTEIYPVRE